MLEAMVIACGANPSLSDVRFLAACLLGFAAFLRYDELSSLKCSDILFFGDHMEVKIRSSKTDQLHQGDHEYVAACSTKITFLEYTAFNQEVLPLQLKLGYQTNCLRGMVVGPQIVPRMTM